MSEQTQQEKQPTECRDCLKAGVKRQLIDFEKIGTNPTNGKDMWQRYDHGTKNLHLHRKLCENGCNTIIIYDAQERKFRDYTQSRDLHSCRSQPEKYRAIAEQHKEFVVSLTTKVLSQPQPQQDQTKNPIDAAVNKDKDDPQIVKKVQLIWALVSNNQAKIDDIHKKVKGIDERMNTFMDSYQKLEAAIKTILTDESNFRTASGKRLSERVEEVQTSTPTQNVKPEFTPTTNNDSGYPEGEVVD